MNSNDENPQIDFTDDEPQDIFVKEVSDGDDESDNDDNGQKKLSLKEYKKPFRIWRAFFIESRVPNNDGLQLDHQ